MSGRALGERLSVTREGNTVEEVLELLEPPAWHADAACREAPPEVTFFPHRGQSGRRAKMICRGCLVLEECRAWALAQGVELQGVFGGMSQQERVGALRGKDWRRRPAVCGTDSGYRRHAFLGEPICAACQDAHDRAQNARAETRRQADTEFRETLWRRMAEWRLAEGLPVGPTLPAAGAAS